MVESALADLGGGVKLNYQQRGRGTPLVCIMGLNGTSQLWSPTFLDPLAERYRVITFDNRGIGGSSGPGPITISNFADDTAKLLDHLRIERAHVFGISMGGMIAQQLAVRYPHRIQKLILGATTCAVKFVRPSLALYSLLLLPVAPRFALSAVFSPAYLHQHAERIREILGSFQGGVGSLTNARKQFLACRRFDLAEAVAEIPHETLIITGTGDRIINAENSEILARKIRRSKLVQLPKVGHAFHAEAEAATLAAFIQHLA